MSFPTWKLFIFDSIEDGFDFPSDEVSQQGGDGVPDGPVRTAALSVRFGQHARRWERLDERRFSHRQSSLWQVGFAVLTVCDATKLDVPVVLGPHGRCALVQKDLLLTLSFG